MSKSFQTFDERKKLINVSKITSRACKISRRRRGVPVIAPVAIQSKCYSLKNRPERAWLGHVWLHATWRAMVRAPPKCTPWGETSWKQGWDSNFPERLGSSPALDRFPERLDRSSLFASISSSSFYRTAVTVRNRATTVCALTYIHSSRLPLFRVVVRFFIRFASERAGNSIVFTDY